jgi:redox-sensing transcriptional repressor
MNHYNRIARMVRYRDALRRMRDTGHRQTYSSDLGAAVGEKGSQVRKDFSMFGLTGTKRDGYRIDGLLASMDTIMKKQEPVKAVIAGYGRLGKALIEYGRFRDENIHILAAFEADPEKVDRTAAVPVLPVAELEPFARGNSILLGIIAVPYDVAAGVFNSMLSSGIKGVLNFAPVHLNGPDDYPLHNISLAAELEVLAYLAKLPTA